MVFIESRRRTFSVYPIFFCYAFYLATLGQLIPYMQSKYNLALGTAGLFSTLQSIGGIVAAIICIVYLDIMNKPKVLGLLGICFAVQMVVLGVAPNLLIIYMLFLIVGFVNSMVNTLSNAVVSDYTNHRRSLYLNLLHGFFGLGGAVGSQITRVLSDTVDMGTTYVYFGCFCFVCVAVFLFVISKDIKKPAIIAKQSPAKRIKELRTVLKKHGMIIVLLVAFFNAFASINILYWSYSFAFSISKNTVIAAMALTSYFVMMTIGRFVSSRFTHQLNPKQFISVGSLLSAVAIISACLSNNIVFAIVMFGLLGLFSGNNYPQIVVQSCNIAPNNSAAATGIAIAGYFLATIIAPPLIGWAGDVLGLRTALIINGSMFIPAGLLAMKFKDARTLAI